MKILTDPRRPIFTMSPSRFTDVGSPTTIMSAFGFGDFTIQVSCTAEINISNTDIMFVLDTTGSMLEVNPGDSQPRIDVLRDTVKSFHAQMESSKATGTRIRYGFLPYSTNVNVGHLLKDEWVVSEWTYQSRRMLGSGNTSGYYTSWTASSPISGSG